MPSESGEKRAASTTPPNAVARYPPPKLADRLPCPRCRSSNTKFCYYNNYNLSQPRHFCKACRRYWTQGGSLRNVPVGGGTRKNSKRSRSSVTSNSKPEPEPEPKPLVLPATNPDSANLPAINCDASSDNLNLNENHHPAGTGSGNFISLLNAQHEPGFMGMVGYGYGSCEIGLGFGEKNTTAYSGFGDFGGGIGNYEMFGGGESESFVWPGFPISKGFK